MYCEVNQNGSTHMLLHLYSPGQIPSKVDVQVLKLHDPDNLQPVRELEKGTFTTILVNHSLEHLL